MLNILNNVSLSQTLASSPSWQCRLLDTTKTLFSVLLFTIAVKTIACMQGRRAPNQFFLFLFFQVQQLQINLICYASFKQTLCVLSYTVCCCFLFLAVALMYSFALRAFYWPKINVILLLLLLLLQWKTASVFAPMAALPCREVERDSSLLCFKKIQTC